MKRWSLLSLVGLMALALAVVPAWATAKDTLVVMQEAEPVGSRSDAKLNSDYHERVL